MSVYNCINGRNVHLVGFRMLGTYSGMLEGSIEDASKYIRTNLNERVARLLPPNSPLVVVEPPQGELPQWICIGEFESNRGARNSDPDFNSQLNICWLMADTSRSLDEVIASILPYVDWEGNAKDYDLMDF